MFSSPPTIPKTSVYTFKNMARASAVIYKRNALIGNSNLMNCSMHTSCHLLQPPYLRWLPARAAEQDQFCQLHLPGIPSRFPKKEGASPAMHELWKSSPAH